MKNKILILGPNPVWQRVVIFDQLTMGKINRAKFSTEFASGKGINFSRALTIHGFAQAILLQFIGGNYGKKIAIELNKEAISAINIEIPNGETRICTTCLSEIDQTMTELIEPSPWISPENLQDFRQKAIMEISNCQALALCGTLPRNADFSIYSDPALKAINEHKLILLDSYLNIESLLEQSQNNVILKINADELTALTGIADVKKALKFLNGKYHLAFIAITDGAKRSILMADHKIYSLDLPKLEKIVNPIGCGDTTSAVLLAEFLKSGDPVQSFRLAAGAASSNCLSVKCAEFDRDFAADYAKNIKIKLEE